MRCDLYQNPYKTRCSGSISPDGGVSVCYRHLATSRDEWMDRANLLMEKSRVIPQQNARIAVLEAALESIAGDEKQWHTCEHSDRAREALT